LEGFNFLIWGIYLHIGKNLQKLGKGMKYNFNTIKKGLATGLLAVGFAATAQQYPFPIDVEYPFGYKPSGVASSTAATAYTNWKNAYLVDGPSCAGTGTKRVKFDAVSGRFGISGDNGIVSVSEGIAYGMLLSAYYGNKADFDALWKYYQRFDDDGDKIMDWGINNNGCTVVGNNGATDAELDVAWALYVAHWQFGGGGTGSSSYKTDAITMIQAIKAHEIDKSGGLNTLKPGDEFGGHGSGNNNLVNISYFSPMYYRVFGELTGDEAFWTSVYNRGYDIMEKAMNKNTGLVPDWCTSTGTIPAQGAAQYEDAGVNFIYDAIRTPVRVALDYLWYGDQAPRALAYTKTVNNWLRAKHPNPADIGAKYNLAGDRLNAFHNNTFVGCFAVSAMATDDPNTRAYITSLYNENVKVNPQAGEYFNATWKALSLFIMSGNFYLPPPDACDGPYLEPDYHLCQGTGSPKALVLDTYLPGASKYEWKRDGVVISGAAAQTYTASIPGNYEVTTTLTVGGKPCVRRVATVVYPATPTASFSFVRNGTAVDFTNTSKGGDLFSETPSLTSAWKFTNGNDATPLTSTTPNGATQYSSAGLKVVTLTVTNKCSNTSSYTAELPLPTASGPGWYGTNFTGQSQGLIAAYNSSGVNPNVTITSNCQYTRADIKTAMGRYETVAITFKGGTGTNGDNELNISGYPYVRFRVRVNATSNPFTANGLRVDLAQRTAVGPPEVFTASGSNAANIVYLKGPRNANGSYENIPLNEWFISTLSFEGKLSAIDPTKVLQLAFTPYNDFATTTGRVPFSIDIDWVTVGNADIPKPSPGLASGTTYMCETDAFRQITGADLDSCNAETATWADGFTGFARKVGVGTYTVNVANFGGVETRTITVAKSPKIEARASYTVVSNSPFQIQPYDNSLGQIKTWRWHRLTTTTQTPSATYTTAAGNSMLYTITNQIQAPGASPTGPPRPTSAIFTGATTEYLCLVITAADGLSACLSTSAVAPNTATKFLVKVEADPLALEEIMKNYTVGVYPTVVNDNILYVEMGSQLKGQFEVSIHNLQGAKVHATSIDASVKQIHLNSDLPAGTYVINFKDGNTSVTKKFIKQ
jgi:endoglucanase